jgi:tetratricopeptide (TPR) repeat protein
MLKAWTSLCHTPCARVIPHLTISTPHFYRSGGALASAMKSGPMDAAAAPKERTEVRFMTLQIERELSKAVCCSPPLQADELIEKVYANMSACHIKRENWKRAQETAEKALARNSKNYKAMFRRGKALGEQGFFERAEKILEELIKESPAGKLALLRSCRVGAL